MIPRCCVLAVIILLSSPIFGRTPKKHLPIIDVHLHCYAADDRWKVRAPNPVTGRPVTATTEASDFLRPWQSDECFAAECIDYRC